MIITKYKQKLLLLEPFFGYLILKLKFIETESVKTMAVDGIHFWYSPSFIKKHTPLEILGVVVHELLHCVLMHPTRGAKHNREISNYAADYVVNDYIINKTTFVLPDCRLYDERFQNMTYDAVYKILIDEAQGKPKPDLVKQSEKMGKFEPAPTQVDPEDTAGQSLEEYWKNNLQEAAEVIKQSGSSLSPAIDELVKNTVAPQLPWNRLLHRFCVRSIKTLSTWNVPHRRFVHQGLFLPSKANKGLQELIIAVDTSCSVTILQFEHMLAEINKILLKLKPVKLTLIHCDDKIAKVETYSVKDYPIKTSMAGRRYTAFKPVFDYVKEHNLRPNCLVYFSDLEGDTNFKPPSYPVLWINTAYPNNMKPKFGKVIGLNIQ